MNSLTNKTISYSHQLPLRHDVDVFVAGGGPAGVAAAVSAARAGARVFLAEGHSWHSGIFRKHVQRLVRFLEGAKFQNEVVREIVKRARDGNPLPGEWTNCNLDPSLWSELAKALGI